MLTTRKEILNAQEPKRASKVRRNLVSFGVLIPIRVWKLPPRWKLAHSDNEAPLLTLGAM